MVDRFNNSPSLFLFLISTRAGGLGLNLTSANKRAHRSPILPVCPIILLLLHAWFAG